LNTLKNAGLFQPKFGSNIDKLKCWVKMQLKNLQLKNLQLKSESYKTHHDNINISGRLQLHFFKSQYHGWTTVVSDISI